MRRSQAERAGGRGCAGQDYDDAYIVEYALQARGCVVSNDMYRDYIGAQEVLQRTQGVRHGVL